MKYMKMREHKSLATEKLFESLSVGLSEHILSNEEIDNEMVCIVLAEVLFRYLLNSKAPFPVVYILCTKIISTYLDLTTDKENENDSN